MARMQVRSGDIEEEGVSRNDLNYQTSGKAVVRKLVQGSGIYLSSSGADAGTGDVTIALSTVTANRLISSNGSGVIGAGNITVNANNALSPLKVPYGVTPLHSEGGNIFDDEIFPLLLSDRGDLLRWTQPSTREYYDYAVVDDFVTWSQDCKTLTDGKGETGVSIDYAHRTIRLTFDTGTSYHFLSLFAIYRAYMYPYRDCTITIEESANNSTWTTKVNAKTLLGTRASHFVTSDDASTLSQRYIRITLDYALQSGESFLLSGIQGWTWRVADQGGIGLHKQLPIYWDENKNVVIGGTNVQASGLSIWKDTTNLGNDENSGAFSIISGASDTKLTLGAKSGASGYGVIQTLQNGIGWGVRPLLLQPIAGKVSIGTTTAPTETFEVYGTAKILNHNLFYSNRLRGYAGDNLHIDAASGQSLFLNYYVGDHVYFGASGNSGIFTGGGYLSVGTNATVSGVKLNVKGSGEKIRIDPLTGNNGGLEIYSTTETNNPYFRILMQGMGSTHYIDVQAGDGADYREIRVQAAGGNLTIGGSSSVAKLNVIGNAFVQGTQGFNASNETATLFLGDSNNAVLAKYGVGVYLAPAGASWGILVAQNTGNTDVEGTLRAYGGYLSYSTGTAGIDQNVQIYDTSIGKDMIMQFEGGLLIGYTQA